MRLYLGQFRWRLVLAIVAILLLWHSSKYWLIFAQQKYSLEAQLQGSQVKTDFNQKDDPPKQKVHVAVYYEALCPDSRSFFIRQLVPTYQKIAENMEVELIPYGKAKTDETDNGYKFVCQHGPIECQANMIHACSIDIIKDPLVQLEYLSCMIKNNIEPVNIMHTCAKNLNLDADSILQCYTEPKGKELLAKYGEKTNALRPRVSFIPTVTLDGSSNNQVRILKNLLHEVCLLLKVTPEGCT